MSIEKKKWTKYTDEYLGKVFRWHIEEHLYVDVTDEYEKIEEMILEYTDSLRK